MATSHHSNGILLCSVFFPQQTIHNPELIKKNAIANFQMLSYIYKIFLRKVESLGGSHPDFAEHRTLFKNHASVALTDGNHSNGLSSTLKMSSNTTSSESMSTLAPASASALASASMTTRKSLSSRSGPRATSSGVTENQLEQYQQQYQLPSSARNHGSNFYATNSTMGFTTSLGTPKIPPLSSRVTAAMSSTTASSNDPTKQSLEDEQRNLILQRLLNGTSPVLDSVSGSTSGPGSSFPSHSASRPISTTGSDHLSRPMTPRLNSEIVAKIPKTHSFSTKPLSLGAGDFVGAIPKTPSSSTRVTAGSPRNGSGASAGFIATTTGRRPGSTPAISTTIASDAFYHTFFEDSPSLSTSVGVRSESTRDTILPPGRGAATPSLLGNGKGVRTASNTVSPITLSKLTPSLNRVTTSSSNSTPQDGIMNRNPSNFPSQSHTHTHTHSQPLSQPPSHSHSSLPSRQSTLLTLPSSGSSSAILPQFSQFSHNVTGDDVNKPNKEHMGLFYSLSTPVENIGNGFATPVQSVQDKREMKKEDQNRGDSRRDLLSASDSDKNWPNTSNLPHLAQAVHKIKTEENQRLQRETTEHVSQVNRVNQTNQARQQDNSQTHESDFLKTTTSSNSRREQQLPSHSISESQPKPKPRFTVDFPEEAKETDDFGSLVDLPKRLFSPNVATGEGDFHLQPSILKPTLLTQQDSVPIQRVGELIWKDRPIDAVWLNQEEEDEGWRPQESELDLLRIESARLFVQKNAILDERNHVVSKVARIQDFCQRRSAYFSDGGIVRNEKGKILEALNQILLILAQEE